MYEWENPGYAIYSWHDILNSSTVTRRQVSRVHCRAQTRFVSDDKEIKIGVGIRGYSYAGSWCTSTHGTDIPHSVRDFRDSFLCIIVLVLCSLVGLVSSEVLFLYIFQI